MWLWILLGIVALLLFKNGGLAGVIAGGGTGTPGQRGGPAPCAPPGYLDANGNCVGSPPRVIDPPGGVINCIRAPCPGSIDGSGGAGDDDEFDLPWYTP